MKWNSCSMLVSFSRSTLLERTTTQYPVHSYGYMDVYTFPESIIIWLNVYTSKKTLRSTPISYKQFGTLNRLISYFFNLWSGHFIQTIITMFYNLNQLFSSFKKLNISS
ncbi:unnamed protein product [Schistosoma haematobium]|nr:unnamed protein product [Schistosoma haematobium]CAH8464487.1 unnamed protein product [Schistosoma haematobium]